MTSLRRSEIVRHQVVRESAGLGVRARRAGSPGWAGREEASQCSLCAYRGHSSTRNARCARPHLFPQAVCSTPLYTFADGLFGEADSPPPPKI